MGRCEKRVEVSAADAYLITANASPNLSVRIDEGRAFGYSTIKLVPYLIVGKRSFIDMCHLLLGVWHTQRRPATLENRRYSTKHRSSSPVGSGTLGESGVAES